MNKLNFIKLVLLSSLLALFVGCASLEVSDSTDDQDTFGFADDSDFLFDTVWDSSNCAHITADGQCAHKL